MFSLPTPTHANALMPVEGDIGKIWFFGFWFWFLVFVYNTASPVVGTLLPAKTWATCLSTLCFHRDSKVSIDSSD